MVSGGAISAVGVFGKLPSHPDFIRLNAGGASARAWDDWLGAAMSGMRGWGPDWEAKFDSLPSLNFLARPTPDQRAALIGQCRPSRDQGGRRYPLTVFHEVALDRHGRGLHAIPFTFSPFLEEAERMSKANESGNDLARHANSLGAWVPANAMETPRELTDHVKGVSMEAFWMTLFGSFDDPRKYLLTKNFFGTLAPLRGYEPHRLRMGLRLPGASLPGPGGSGMTMAVWLLLTRAVAGEQMLAQACLFWHTDESLPSKSCLLFFSMPGGGMAQSILNPAMPSETIWDMANMGNERIGESRDALGPAITSVLDSPRYSLLDFIQRI